ncbi:MAG: hypothetical protein K0V04_34380, partial [Deltaproteobacteria bacterium]|nr:hypothetical protein [Deltaproteobacteria bacterium]
MNEPLVIIEVGMFSPVGLDARQTLGSILAGIARKSETPFRDTAFEPIIVGHLPSDAIPPIVPSLVAPQSGLTPLQVRMIRLAGPALHEVLGAEPQAGEAEANADAPSLTTSLSRSDMPPPPLFVAGPQPLPGKVELTSPSLAHHIARHTGLPIDVDASEVFTTGHAGFFDALAAATAWLDGPDSGEFAIVGGVDSYFDEYRLSVLERAGRLQTAGPQDAFTPGEAAAFVLVTTKTRCRLHGLSPIAWIPAVGRALEPGHRHSQEPHRGDGLAEALDAV